MTELLRANGLTYTVKGGPRILANVDVTVRAGGVTGVLGPNGSGKTTLMRILIGALHATAGDVVVGNTPVDSIPLLERARMLALVEQDSRPHEDLTAGEVVALGRLPHQGRFGAADPRQEAVELAAARAGVTELLGRRFHSLSGGERQRVHLARALAQMPRVLLLDEPTNHLDISAQLHLLSLVTEVAAGGAGVLLTLHDLSLAARVCDEVVVLDHGRVAAAGPPRQVLTPDLIRAVWHVNAEWVEAGANSALIYT